MFAAPLIAAPTLLGAGVGVVVSAMGENDGAASPGGRRLWGNVAAGGAWGAGAGLFLTRAIPPAALGAAVGAVRVALLAAVGVAVVVTVLALAARREGAGRALARAAGILLAAAIVIGSCVVLPAIDLPVDMRPTRLPEAEARRVLTAFATNLGVALALLFALSRWVTRALWSDMLIVVTIMAAGAAAGAIVTGGVGVHVLDVALGVGAATGVLSFLGFVAGAAFATALGLVFLVVSILLPEVEALADVERPARGPDEFDTSNPGMRAARAMGGFARLVADGGAAQTIVFFALIFGFLGAICGVMASPFAGAWVLETLRG